MQIGAGWRKRDKNGKQYLSVVLNLPLLGDLNLVLYVNENKMSDGQPDYVVNWFPKTNGSKQQSVEDEEIPF